MLVRTSSTQNQVRCPLAPTASLGQFSLPSLPSLDWKVLAGIAAVVVLIVLLTAGGKRARRKRRAELIKARLEYAEKAARIKRKSL